MQISSLLAACLIAASTANAIQAPRGLFPSTPHSRMEKRLLPGFDGGNSGNDNGGLNPSSSEDLGSTSAASSTQSTSTSLALASSTTQQSSTSTSQTTSSASSTSTRTRSASSSIQSSTDSRGSVVMVTSTISASTSSSTPIIASQTNEAAASSSGGSSHTGLIVGVSVVGGIAILGALIFLYMKFGGKRFSDYQDDDHDIKWPELKTDDNAAAMQPLPARRTGGAGFDMGEESEMGHDNLDRQSMTEYGAKGQESVVGSTTALNTGVGTNYSTNAYGHDGNTLAYEDNSPYGNNGSVTGYYDPYNNYSHGQTPSQGGPQIFYPDQVGNVQDYQQHAYETSPPNGPHHVGGQYGNGYY